VRHGECLIAADGSGAALWVPPGCWHGTPRQQLGVVPLLGANCGRACVRSLRTLARMESAHPRNPHFFLPFVGVEPAQQGRGVGSALLRPVLERCDREDVPAYLEASSPRNRVLYERHGFVTFGELPLLRGCPPVWMMWREPGGGAPRAAERRDLHAAAS
jgi:GNAT superfamily N-acetyltransferase